MEIETTESSCHRCPVCTDRHLSDVSDGELQNISPLKDACRGDTHSDLPPEGVGLAAATLLLFFVPAALSFAGATTLGKTAATQWLGGISGFSAGIFVAICISNRIWNTTTFDIGDTNPTALD
ncbi:MAG: hypothetical protein JXM70_12000 [Pirellulales bacterium]|nr:hypothetical protein [Pirellulales bacterium]